MQRLRRYRDCLALLMTVAVTCNIILAMLCCAPIGSAHSAAYGEGDLFASVICISVKRTLPDQPEPSGHRSLHSDCLRCLGPSSIALEAPVPAVVASAGLPLAGEQTNDTPPSSPLNPSHFAFAEPVSRGPPAV